MYEKQRATLGTQQLSLETTAFAIDNAKMTAEVVGQMKESVATLKQTYKHISVDDVEVIFFIKNKTFYNMTEYSTNVMPLIE